MLSHLMATALIMIGMSAVLWVVLKIVDVFVQPFRKQLKTSNAPQLSLGDMSGIQLNPLDAIGTTESGQPAVTCVEPLAATCEATEAAVENVGEGISSAMEAGAEAVSGLLEGLSS